MKRKLTNRLTALLLSAFTVISSLPFLGWGMRVRAVSGADIASVPAVRNKETGSGTFTLTTGSRFFIATNSDPSKTDVGLFVQTVSSEFAAKEKPSSDVLPIVYGNKILAKEGDIIIIPDSDAVDKAQGYKLTVDAKNITVEAKDAAGVLNGLHTVLQSLVRGGDTCNTLNGCTVTDWPDVAERSVYLDCGRVYFKPDTIKALIRTLSWNKMNVLYLDFSNNNATRFFLDKMEVTVGGTTYDITKAKPTDYLSQSDMDGIIAEANKYGVQIIPTFNSPGHIGGISGVASDLFTVNKSVSDYDSTANGGKGKIALDVRNEDSYAFGQAVVKLYVDYFASKGCKNFNVAADEISDVISAFNPDNDEYENSVTYFVKYINELDDYIVGKGMTTRMFNDGFRSLDLGFNKDITVMYWTTESLTAQKLIDAGYKVVNLNCHAGLYYAYCKGINSAYVWNQDVDKIYAGWNPGVTSCKVTWGTSSYAYEPQEWIKDYANEANYLGAAFAIWTDYAFCNINGKDGTTIFAENYKNMMQKIYTVAERSWSTVCTDSYSTWSGKLNAAPAGLSLTGSVLTDKLPTPSAITLEAEMNCVVDSEGVVKVYAPGIDGLTVSRLRGESGIADANSSILYTVTPTVGDAEYTGKGVISIKVPDEMKDKTVRGVVSVNGKLTTVSGTLSADGEWFTFDAPSFPATYGLAQVNYSKTVPVRVSVGGSKTIMIEDDDVSGTYTTDDPSVATVKAEYTEATEATTRTEYTRDTSVTCGTLISNNTNSWRKVSGYYYKVNGNYYQLYVQRSSGRDNSYPYNRYYTYTWGYSTTGSNSNVEQIGTQKVYTDNASTTVPDITIYTPKTVDVPATSEGTKLTFNGNKIGKTSVIIGGVLYEIEVVVVADSVTLPISIIDYRSDGLLFDYDYNNTSYGYSLVHSNTYPGEGNKYNHSLTYGTSFAGDDLGTRIAGTYLEIRNRYADDISGGNQGYWGMSPLNGGWVRTGMLEKNLGKNGLPVYTDATVQAVAYLISKGLYSSAVANTTTLKTNKTFVNTFLSSSATRSLLNTTTTGMSDQFAQAQTYDNITNAYDLAWYLLNNLYVADTNMVTDSGKTVPIYGMATNTYKGIVLRKTTITDTDGNTFDGYAYDSAYATTYDKTNGYIYNTDPAGAIKTTKSSVTTRFWPIDNDGYDSDEYYGGKTSSWADAYNSGTQNGNFTFVGSAEFVYKENDYFYFSGDDDVYLYINGKLALDLGGGHGVCYKEIKLSELDKDEYGLVEGQPATFTFFYMERCSDNSNFSMRTNIELMNSSMEVKKNAYTESGNVAITSGFAISSHDKVVYDFVVKNTGNADMTNLLFNDNDGSFGNNVYFGETTAKNTDGTGNVKFDYSGPFTVWFDSDPDNKKVCSTYDELNTYIAGLTLKQGDTLHVKGLKATISPNVNTVFAYENALTVTAKAGDKNLTGSDTHKLYSFNIGDTSMAYVVDFGLPMTISRLFDASVDATKYVKSVALATTGKYGTIKLITASAAGDTSLEYILTSPISGAEIIELDVTLDIEGTSITTHKYVTIIPATTVYYEDNFSDFIKFDGVGCKWTTDGTEIKDRYQNADRIGDAASNVYGYDGAYVDMSKFSLGSAHKVTVSGSNYATAEFSFYGTGFDVISATTNTSGTIVVTVTDADGKSKNYLVDTYYGYTYDSATGKWTPAPNTEKALWQIPVMKVAGLDYGKYTVTITVAYADFFSHGQNGGGSYDFWLDAIRIYDPAGAVAGKSDEQADYDKAYAHDGEGWPTYKELRDMIIRDGAFTTDSTKANGMIFIDGQSGKVSMADYTSYGPNNELYLANGQAVAFKLNATGDVADIQIALKNIVAGKNASYKIFAIGGDATATELKTATDMYHSIKDLNGKTVVIMNVGDADSILSITNLKVTYGTKPTGNETLSITMDGEAALAAVSAVDEVLNPKTPFEPGEIDVKVDGDEVTVITSPDVDEIEIDGEKVTDSITDPKTGKKIWKKSIKRNLEYNPEISVVARDKNGNTSAPVTAPVVSGGSMGSLIGGFLGKLIKNILSALFG